MADLISVIVPVYNIAGELPRCLDSILAQKHPNIEIIAVNDGSSDHSGKVLDEYAQLHPCIHVIHQENGGVTSARLRGIEEASGDWIGFVDGDDEIEPDMYERLMVNALKYHADISHCGYQMVFPDGRVNYFYNTGYLAEQDKTTALRELLSGSRIEPGLCNKLFHKTLFHSLLHGEAVPLDIKINEDLLMNFYLFKEADHSIYEDFCPYHYIVRSTSASRQKLNAHKIYDPIRVKERILEDSPEAVKQEAQQALFRTCINIYSTIILADQPELQETARDIRCKIIGQWANVKLLSRKQRLLAAMIRYLPAVYPAIYGFYAAKLQKNRYT